MKRRLFLLAASLMFAAAAQAGDTAPAAPAGSVWKWQRIHFQYVGYTSRYSCDGLRDKVRALMLALGVRRDLSITATGCWDTRPLNEFAGLVIEFSAPVPASPKLVADHPGDLAAVDAGYHSFKIERDAFRNLDVGDCELIEQFAIQILSKLSVYGLKKDLHCIPHQLSGSRYRLEGYILMPEGHEVGRR
jgi:hypothetical protein